VAQVSFVLSQFMRLRDGRTGFSWLVRAGIPYAARYKR